MAHSNAVRATLGRLAREIITRRVVPWTLAYLAGAWALIESSGHFATVYAWPDAVEWALPIVLAVGTLSVVTVAWFHGAAGWQRVTRRELFIHGAIALLLLPAFKLWPPEPEEVTATVTATATPVTRVAVLDFVSHSQDSLATVLSESLTEEVAHRLARVPALDVVPLPVTRESRAAESLEAMKVGAFVEGSVTCVGDSVRVAVQLVETGTTEALGSWIFTCRVGAPQCLVPWLAEPAADSARVTLGGELRRRRAESGATVADALAPYHRAWTIVHDQASVEWKSDSRAGLALLDEADRLLAEAEARDPAWPAPVQLRMHVAQLESQLMGGAGSHEPGRLRAAIAHADRALALVRDSSGVLEERGQLLLTLAHYCEPLEADRLLQQAERDLRSAAALDPDNPRAWAALSELDNTRGAFESAYTLAVRAYETDSFLDLEAVGVFRLILQALQIERLEEARHWCREGRRLYPRDQLILQGCLQSLVSLDDPTRKDVEEAWATAAVFGEPYAGMAERRGEWMAWGRAITAAILARRGEADSAAHVLRRAVPVLEAASPDMRIAARYFEALTRYRLGQQDSALQLLRDYVRLDPTRAPALKGDWWFRGLWDDPRYTALYAAATGR